MHAQRLTLTAAACSAMLWAMVAAAPAVAIPLPQAGAWEGPINRHGVNHQTGKLNHVGTVKFCVSGDRAERVDVSLEARGGRIEANLGHTTMFEAIVPPPYHHESPYHHLPTRRETRFQVTDHKVDPRLSLSLVVQWVHQGEPQHPKVGEFGAHGRVVAVEQGRLGEQVLKHDIGPVHRVGRC